MTRGCVYMFRLDPRSAVRANVLAPVVFLTGLLYAVESAGRLRSRRAAATAAT